MDVLWQKIVKYVYLLWCFYAVLYIVLQRYVPLWDSPRLLVCDAGVYLKQNDIGFITVAICGGFNPYIA